MTFYNEEILNRTVSIENVHMLDIFATKLLSDAVRKIFDLNQEVNRKRFGSLLDDWFIEDLKKAEVDASFFTPSEFFGVKYISFRWKDKPYRILLVEKKNYMTDLKTTDICAVDIIYSDEKIFSKARYGGLYESKFDDNRNRRSNEDLFCNINLEEKNLNVFNPDILKELESENQVLLEKINQYKEENIDLFEENSFPYSFKDVLNNKRYDFSMKEIPVVKSLLRDRYAALSPSSKAFYGFKDDDENIRSLYGKCKTVNFKLFSSPITQIFFLCFGFIGILGLCLVPLTNSIYSTLGTVLISVGFIPMIMTIIIDFVNRSWD